MVEYRGTRNAQRPSDISVLVVDGDSEYPLPHIIKHSPDGFEWGYTGSGPADLSRCLLIHALDAQLCDSCGGRGCFSCDAGIVGVPPEMYQRFKFEVVSRLPEEGWILSRDEVLAAIQ